MPIKSALCAAALALTALALPASAQQAPQDPDTPAANSTPDANRAPDDEGGPRWRRRMGPPGYFDEDEGRRGYREGRRYGHEDEDGGPRFHGRRFGGMQGPGMGPGMMGMDRFCGPDSARIGEFMMDRIERITRPTGDQRAAFDKLKEAAGKASEIVRAGCPTERPLTPPGRLAAAEKRLTAMLEAIRTVRPAMDAYYAALSDEQKARLTLLQPGMGHRGGMGPHRFWRNRGEGRDDNGRGDRTQFGPDDDSGVEKL